VTAAAVRVSRWVSTPMTPSTRSASTVMDLAPSWSTVSCRPGGTPRGEPVMSHDTVVGQAAVSGQERWCQVDVGTRQTTRHQGNQTVPDRLWVMPRCRRQSLAAILQDRSQRLTGRLTIELGSRRSASNRDAELHELQGAWRTDRLPADGEGMTSLRGHSGMFSWACPWPRGGLRAGQDGGCGCGWSGCEGAGSASW